ncbi:MAG: helix-turn-helix domain-containing protein [Actinobacteria bacterium]|nr:helix-turn-helix domain-containing protein [Actinomycetota bacterium]
MVDEEWLSAAEVAQLLGVNLNNLRQIQYRKSLAWGKKKGRSVFYLRSEVEAYAARRAARNKL